jgi:hypothetical protein
MLTTVAAGAMLALVSGVHGQGTLRLDIQHRRDVQRLQPRTGPSFNTPLTNNLTGGGIYVTTVTIGTPPQTLTLQVDTGSSDTWVPASNATICRDKCFYGSCKIPYN